jgi:hypothetical protein
MLVTCLVYFQPWKWTRLLSIYLSIYLSIFLSICSPLLDLERVFSFLIFYTVGMTPRTGDQSVARPLPAHRTAQTQNKRTQTSMPGVEFELTIPIFERGKTVHALDSAANVINMDATCSSA